MADAKRVQLSFGLAGRLNTVVGKEPPPPAADPLPPLGGKVQNAGSFSIRLPALLEYSGIEEKLKSSLVGRRLQLPQGTIVPTDFSVYPSGDKLVLGVSFQGEGAGWWPDTSGTIYLAGKPAYDAATQLFRVEQFDFTRKLSNPVVAAAAWVLQDSLRDQLQQRLVYDLTETIDRAQSDLDVFLDRPLGDNLFMSGKVSDLAIAGIRLEKPGILIELETGGELTLELGSAHRSRDSEEAGLQDPSGSAAETMVVQ
jgi:hypothetical protein